MEVDVNLKLLMGNSRVLRRQIRLLKAIERTKSITEAAKEVGISYKNAWDNINEINTLAKEPLIVRTSGNRKNSGSELSDYARWLIGVYDQVCLVQREVLRRVCKNLQLENFSEEAVGALSKNLVNLKNLLPVKITQISLDSVSATLVGEVSEASEASEASEVFGGFEASENAENAENSENADTETSEKSTNFGEVFGSFEAVMDIESFKKSNLRVGQSVFFGFNRVFLLNLNKERGSQIQICQNLTNLHRETFENENQQKSEKIYQKAENRICGKILSLLKGVKFSEVRVKFAGREFCFLVPNEVATSLRPYQTAEFFVEPQEFVVVE